MFKCLAAKVRVEIEVIATGRHGKHRERVIKHLGEEGITALSWEVLGDEELVCNLE